MTFFKRRRIKKQLRQLSNEELVFSVSLCLCLLHLRPDKGISNIIQLLLEETYNREGCDSLLLEEVEDLCLQGIAVPYFALGLLMLQELYKNDAREILKRQIATNNLKNWIRFTCARKLSAEVMEMVSESDIDEMERSLRRSYLI